MDDEEPNLVISRLSGTITRDDVTVDVQIYRLERDPQEWSLEVINDKRTSIVWEDTFPSDTSAYDEFIRTVEEEGMNCFLDTAKIIPFKR